MSPETSISLTLWKGGGNKKVFVPPSPPFGEEDLPWGIGIASGGGGGGIPLLVRRNEERGCCW